MYLRNYFLIVVLLMTEWTNGIEIDFQYYNAYKITEETPKNNDIFEGRRFCGWSKRDDLNDVCTSILDTSVFQENYYQAIEGRVEEVKFYKVQRFKLSRGKLKPACKCASHPPIYIRNKKSPTELPTVIISHEDFKGPKTTDNSKMEDTCYWTGNCGTKCKNAAPSCSGDKFEDAKDDCKECCTDFCKCCGCCGSLTCKCIANEIVCLPCTVWNCGACLTCWPLYCCGMKPAYIRWRKP